VKTLRNQITAEFRQLPGALGKLIGGVMVGSGTLAAVLGLKHGVPKSIVLGTIILGAGFWLFVRSLRWLKERKHDIGETASDPISKRRLKVLIWGLFACIVLVSLLLLQITIGL
jgi:hypothetical protein